MGYIINFKAGERNGMQEKGRAIGSFFWNKCVGYMCIDGDMHTRQEHWKGIRIFV